MSFDRDKLGKLYNNKDAIIEMIKNRDLDLYNYMDEVEKSSFINVKDIQYDICICTVGFSIYPLLMSIKILNPKEKLVLIFSKKSYEFKQVFETFKEELDLKFEIQMEIVENESDTAEIYGIIKEALKDCKGKTIALDITGGKKPTIAAGFLGASLYENSNNIDILYMDFKEYENNKPIYGTEFITTLLNPNNIYSSLEKIALKDLFESCQYRAARKLSTSIEKNLKKMHKKFPQYGLESQIEEIEKIRYFASIYEKRIDFIYQNITMDSKYLNENEVYILSRLKDTYTNIGNIKDEISKKYNYMGEKVQKEFLNRIYEEDNKCKDIDLFLVSVDRYVSAIQYKKIDYQAYILRLVSALEVAGIKLSKGRENTLERKLRQPIIEQDRSLLNKLLTLKNCRNNLSLIHGFDFVDKPKEDFEQAVKRCISLTFQVNEDYIERLVNESLNFRSFDEIVY